MEALTDEGIALEVAFVVGVHLDPGLLVVHVLHDQTATGLEFVVDLVEGRIERDAGDIYRGILAWSIGLLLFLWLHVLGTFVALTLIAGLIGKLGRGLMRLRCALTDLIGRSEACPHFWICDLPIPCIARTLDPCLTRLPQEQSHCETKLSLPLKVNMRGACLMTGIGC